jgi:2-dehydropantoate 2-reductase
MKFGILGAGAVGGYFGARLAEAGENVAFIARGAHLLAIREKGLRVESENGGACIQNAQATDDPTEVGPVDFILFAVKLFQTEESAELAAPMVGPNTTFVALQNGVECAETLARIHDKEKVLNGTSYISAVIAEPGLIRQTGKFASFSFGEADGSMSERGQRLKDACDRAGLNPNFSDKIDIAVWMKFVRICTMAGITSTTRKPIGELRSDPDIRRVIEASIHEAVAVARAKGVPLPDHAIAQELKGIDDFPAPMVASMVHDLNGGKRMELDWISGAVCRFGREVGVPTPTHDAFYAVLKPYKDGA